MAASRARTQARSGRGGARAGRTRRTRRPRGPPAGWPSRRRRQRAARARRSKLRRFRAWRSASMRPLSSRSARLQPRWPRHREERLQAAAVGDGLGEALVDLERLGDQLELLAGQVGEHRLRDGDERNLVGNREHREAEAVGLRDDRLRHGVEAEAEPEAEPRQADARRAAAGTPSGPPPSCRGRARW